MSPPNSFGGAEIKGINMSIIRHHRKTCRHYNIPGHAHELTFSCYRGQPFLSEPIFCKFLAEAIGKLVTHSLLWETHLSKDSLALHLCYNHRAGILQAQNGLFGRRLAAYWRAAGSSERVERYQTRHRETRLWRAVAISVPPHVSLPRPRESRMVA